ncbi:methylated-DNA--protein-cysteine methyltransferase isoform X2 [Hippopotamus amphibius kiboko]|nr:methylated-DNA--protein-cysteine methyltransferase isoform X2 [Hippopotamus amphibius kiboko]XP_057593205.1 methylated-DNA--protein-cysteine methyltransferase isoform X2 [Hippopotamus amphibius kiboko]
MLGRMNKTCEMKYKMMDSPLGKIEVSGCEQGLHGIELRGWKTPDSDPMEAPAPPELLGGPEEVMEPLVQCVAWLDAYFHKPAVLKELPVPALHHPIFQQDSFTRQVLWKLLKAVKFGETVSYQQLAALAGNPKAARAAGGAMRRNPVRLYPRAHTHPHPVPQSGLQQRGHGQLLRRRGREGVASGPRRQRGGEAGAWRGLPSSWKLAQGSGWHHQLPACWPGLSVCGSGTPGAGRRLALPY